MAEHFLNFSCTLQSLSAVAVTATGGRTRTSLGRLVTIYPSILPSSSCFLVPQMFIDLSSNFFLQVPLLLRLEMSERVHRFIGTRVSPSSSSPGHSHLCIPLNGFTCCTFPLALSLVTLSKYLLGLFSDDPVLTLHLAFTVFPPSPPQRFPLVQAALDSRLTPRLPSICHLTVLQWIHLTLFSGVYLTNSPLCTTPFSCSAYSLSRTTL